MILSSKSILVTGGAGFVGSRFVRHLIDTYPDSHVMVLDALTYAGSMDNLPDQSNGGYEFWYGNVCNGDLVTTLVAEADIVVHFAAETHVTRSIYDNRLFFETDVLGTQAIANAVLKHADRIELLIHVSTSEVYGTAVTEQMDESHPLNPMSPYAAAKCGADRLIYSYGATYDIPAVIVRPFNIFGPSQHLEKLIPRLVTSALLNEPMTVHGDGSAARDYIYVADICRALDMIMQAPRDKVIGEVFNVCSGRHRSISSIADDIIALMEASPRLKTNVLDRPGQVFRHTGDASKIQRVLGWDSQWDWKDGLRETIEWYGANRETWEKQMWMRHVDITLPDGRTVTH